MEIARVGIIGAGTMGSGIAINLAQHGKRALLFDQAKGQVGKAMAYAKSFFARAVERGRMSTTEADAAITRIAVADTLSDLHPAHLVIEAVFEDFELKARLLESLGPILGATTLVATNTSCLRVSDLQAHIEHPSRFLGLHYFSPAAVNPIVEVIRGTGTGDVAINSAIEFCRETAKLPIRCRDAYGFAINRFFCPYTNEAARVLDEGVAGAADIDVAAREAVGAAAGPFAVMNLIKPRINLHAIRNLAPLGPFYAPARAMVEVGESDRQWDIGEPRGLDARTHAYVIDRLRLGVFLPVLQELDEGVAPPEDIDLGAQEALRFSRPPCALMRELGEEEVRRVRHTGKRNLCSQIA